MGGLSEKGIENLTRFKLLQTLDLKGTNLRDAWIRKLADTQVQVLNLDDNTAILDWSLHDLGQMPNLRQLSLAHTGITDNRLRHLANAPSLFALCLGLNRQLTAAGIKNLDPDKSRLRAIFFNGCDIGDESAADLVKFKNLSTLDLARNPRISDHTLEILGTRKHGIQALIIANDHIGDSGIHSLTKYKDLTELDLSGITLSSRALADLATLKGLKSLVAADCHLTVDQIKAIEKALPDTGLQTTTRMESDLY
jgi:Leucine-rich repeat (LRR) protein